MNFLSPLFLPVLLLTAGMSSRIPPSRRWIPLLAASCFFYIYGEGWGSLLLASVILLTWGCGLALAKTRRPGVRRTLLALALIWCLGSLFVFKYMTFALNAVGVSGMRSLALPVGISFFTFQTLSYVIDVYRGAAPAESHVGLYALYVSFFPQLVAGPIERSGDLLPQLKTPGRVSGQDVHAGLWLMLRGYVKKVLLADTAAAVVDAVYAAPGEASAVAALAALVLFALQIYGDFSGYSDIALGTARLLGVHLTENFRMPYLAGSLRDFWRRWHISLNRWLVDYVYRPLGGSRRGRKHTALNTMIIFLASGLWHGAGWHYLLWGGLHGAALTAERLLLPHAPATRSGRWLRTGLTFAFVCLAWTFFRAESIGDACALLLRLGTGWTGGSPIAMTPLTALRLAFALAAVWRLDLALPKPSDRAAAGAFFLIAACMLALLVQASAGVENSFIYFRF